MLILLMTLILVGAMILLITEKLPVDLTSLGILVVLTVTVILSLNCELDFSPSKVLIPVSYASILAGTCTLIGTSTNIIISDLSAKHGLGPLGMFELSRLGVPIALLGLIFLVFAAPKLMPNMHNPICELKDDDHRRYLAELQVPRDSRIIGQDPEPYFSQKYP